MPEPRVTATVTVKLDLTDLVASAKVLQVGPEGYSSELGRRLGELIIDRLEKLNDDFQRGRAPKVIGDVDVVVELVEPSDPRNPRIQVTASSKGAAQL